MNNLAVVTGAEGFIGSHLVEALFERGDRVRAMVQYNSSGSWGWLDTLPAEVMDGVEVRLADVRDAGSVHDFVADASVVYHLAALIAIPYSYQAPRSYLDTNAGGTLNVLEAVRAHETPLLVHTSTSEVYGTALQVPIDEGHPLQAQSPYAASKIAADKLVESYHLSFSTPAVTLRPFNTFGPRQSARAVIPTVTAQIAAGAERIRLGSLDPTRDFNFVRNTVEGFLALGAMPPESVAGSVFNAGSGREVSVGEVVGLIAKVMDRQVLVELDADRVRPAGSEVMRLVCDAGRLKQATGWEPRCSLEDGLEATVRWFTDPTNLARYKTDIYNQ
jgi:NDP-hexose 4,6-dehydratase